MLQIMWRAREEGPGREHVGRGWQVGPAWQRLSAGRGCCCGSWLGHVVGLGGLLAHARARRSRPRLGQKLARAKNEKRKREKKKRLFLL